MNISFYGASQTVTGSCYLLETSGKKILIDCGMFQGSDVVFRNAKFEFDPSTIDFVLLTHAHIDHSGLIPKLFREGFKGKIFSTQPTFEISELLLLDSAKIQESNLNSNRKGSSQSKNKFLYDTNDVYAALRSFEILKINENINVDGIKIRFIRAGHVLGAVSILIESEGKRIVFSGDLGRSEQSLINSYELIGEEVDYVVMESLYGGVIHDSRELTLKNFVNDINKTISSGGNVIIPSFALHRSQEIIFDLIYSIKNNQINDNVQIFLDGPLSEKITSLYTVFLNSNDMHFGANSFTKNNTTGRNLFASDNVRYVREHRESLRLMRGSAKIIIAGNGMCEGGRIMNHLARGLKKEKNKILFVGYQAEDTLGRRIVDGEKNLLVNGKNVTVRADITYLHGFSGHADNSDLKKWFEDKKSERLKKVFLTHADIERSTAFSEQIKDSNYETNIPSMNQQFEL